MAGPVPGAEDVEMKDKVSALASFQSKGGRQTGTKHCGAIAGAYGAEERVIDFVGVVRKTSQRKQPEG